MLFRLSLSTVSRSSGRSAVSASAYRSGASLRDFRQGKRFSYRKKRDRIRYTALVGWSRSREELWNRAEQSERRKDSVTAREVLLSLPAELDDESNQRLVHAFASYLRATLGVALDVCIHSAEVGPHAHILFSAREVSDTGEFGRKTKLDDIRGDGPRLVSEMRAEWCRLLNEVLSAQGFAPLDHRAGAMKKSLASIIEEYVEMPISQETTPEQPATWNRMAPMQKARV